MSPYYHTTLNTNFSIFSGSYVFFFVLTAAVKLIQESDFFMDALTAVTRPEPRKRKRRVSSSKDESPSSQAASGKPGGKEPESPSESPKKSMSPTSASRPSFQFYTDTLETSKSGQSMDESEEVNPSDRSKFINCQLKLLRNQNLWLIQPLLLLREVGGYPIWPSNIFKVVCTESKRSNVTLLNSNVFWFSWERRRACYGLTLLRLCSSFYFKSF